jgi:5'-deoxynucleotidase YfbR-like HD superfamily hydrolase
VIPEIIPSIQSRSGRYINFVDPDQSAFCIHDIAHALSHTCRFGGHTRDFYSVAQHSVLVSYLVPENDQFAALMHDAAEAYVGDVPSPLKQLLPEYKVIEKRIEACLFERFGLYDGMPVSVKKADLIMLATEQRDLMTHNSHDLVQWECIRDIEPARFKIRAQRPEDARKSFLERFERLYKIAGGF